MNTSETYRPPLPSPGAANLRRLFALRNLVVVGQTLTVLGVHYGLGIPLPLLPLMLIIGAQTVVIGLTRLRLASVRPVSDGEFFVHLLVDVAALTAMLYFTGGWTNPFVMLYLLPLTLAAAALPGRLTWTMAAVTSGCYSLLTFFHRPLPHVHGAVVSDFDLHVAGMWLGFVLAACVIAFFAVRMAAALRERDRELAALRESELKNERIVALGTLAAGAAHELGTPLSTVAVLARELEREAADAGTREKTRTLREQVQRCKAILSQLAGAAGSTRAEGGRRQPLDRYLREVVARWQATRPGVHVLTRWHGSAPVPDIVGEKTLDQAIVSILNNAADASPDGVDVDGGWNAEELFLEVRDRGPGFAPEARDQVGESLFSTKPPEEGLGLGLFLAQATVQRLGGTVSMHNRDEGGARVRLSLPLDSLLLEAAV